MEQSMNVTKLKRDLKVTGHQAVRFLKRLTTLPQNWQPSAVQSPNSIAAITWFHRIDLGDGIVTPGVEDTPAKLPTFGIPERLDGLSVLDIGAWDGFFSFEAERRGARRVLATDRFCWGGGGWGTKAGFDLAHRILGSKVEDKRIDVLDLSPEAVGVFDLVFFFGVLYHMRHPLLALERVASVTKEQLILETHLDMLDCDRPAMAFYPGSEMAQDSTNWCGPNPPMVEAMLKTVGFRKVIIHSGPNYFVPYSPRMVFHAWK
jgi:tRNA (mo5U34)-methyltransferase